MKRLTFKNYWPQLSHDIYSNKLVSKYSYLLLSIKQGWGRCHQERLILLIRLLIYRKSLESSSIRIGSFILELYSSFLCDYFNFSSGMDFTLWERRNLLGVTYAFSVRGFSLLLGLKLSRIYYNRFLDLCSISKASISYWIISSFSWLAWETGFYYLFLQAVNVPALLIGYFWCSDL